MAKLESLDPTTPMFAQFMEKTGPIVLANTFVVPKDRAESFLAHFTKQAEFMKSQPGFVSLQMHQGTAGSQLFMNVAIWESTEALAKALGNPRFQALSAEVPDDIVSYPHIFEKIAVEGLCAGEVKAASR
ncbi:MAG TPA: antibiotic biosynthesis monooxygenase family protein [Pseudonocardiaceae bacterium]|jgi:quinol monooxygenase YgiN|nr:antibiotic biosynthesis monooxygenase family protein [Pseudonocardiaceae bacterium]